MAKFREEEVIGFSHWVSALVDGDLSGLEDEDIEMLKRWEKWHGLPDWPVRVRDEGFLPDVFEGLGGDAYTYTYLIDEYD